MRISDWSSDVCSSDLYSQRALPWWKSAPDPEAIRLPLGPLRWGPVPVPQGEELTFLTGLRSMTTAGDVALQTGMPAHLYLVNAPLRREYFPHAAGELLVVPPPGALPFPPDSGRLGFGPGAAVPLRRR